jgi:hypothetical protein
MVPRDRRVIQVPLDKPDRPEKRVYAQRIALVTAEYFYPIQDDLVEQFYENGYKFYARFWLFPLIN